MESELVRLGKAGLERVSGMFGGKPGVPKTRAVLTPAEESHHALLLLRDYEKSGLGWFWSTDETGTVIYISEFVAESLGIPRNELIGQPFHKLFRQDGDDADGYGGRSLPLIFNGRKTFSDVEVRGASEDSGKWWAISGRPQFNQTGEFTGYHGNGIDITSKRQTAKDASRLAMYDSLTGLANRHRMGKRLDATLTAYKAAKRSCALMMIDLDRFKQVNDTLGHPAGDDLLKQVAQRLRQVVAEGAEIGRLGGDEFQIILPDMDDRGKLGDLGKKIIAIVSQPYSVEGSRCVIGASVGIAIAPYDGITSEELVRSADLALYASKGGGRGQFRFYSTELHAEAERRRQIEDDLRDALAKNEIYLAYQPQIETATNKVIGFDAVMRWNHPELGEVSPGIFIPIAEDIKLIGALGDWAIRQACEDAAKLPGNVRMAVNISAAQFANPNFPQLVAQVLAATELAAERLELELTESIFVDLSGEIDERFTALKMLGVRLALDDFGTGYSSLSYLQAAPFDKIKIDQSFIRDVTIPGSRNAAIIKAIVSLAESLGMDTTAEGIEAHDELDLMRDLKVKQIQGFLYARALTYDEVEEAMNSGQWFIDPDGPNKYRADRRTMLRKVGLIHEDYRYDVTMRNLSRSGCMIEGLIDVPVGTQFVVDLGEGQLAVATVKRSSRALQGLEFELPLVDDGAGGLCTRNRISPYMLAAAGMPLAALPSGNYPLIGPGSNVGPPAVSVPKFAEMQESVRKTVRVSTN